MYTDYYYINEQSYEQNSFRDKGNSYYVLILFQQNIWLTAFVKLVYFLKGVGYC